MKKRIPGYNDKTFESEIDVDFENATNRGAGGQKKKPIADPEKVLAALEYFINSRPIIEKRMDQIAIRFAEKSDLIELR